MKRFFPPNIDRRGRWLRALSSLALLGGAAAAHQADFPRIALAMLALGVFVAFEAARGWCIARACGIKTRF